MKRFVQMIFLMSDWKIDPRKHLTKELIYITQSWSEIMLVQLPVSLFVHLFTRFKSKILGLLKGEYKTKKIEGNAILYTPVILFHYNLWLKFKVLAWIDTYILSYQLNKYAKNKFPGKEVFLWIYYPRLYPVLNKLHYKLLVYDFQDNYDYDYFGKKVEIDAHYNREVIKMSDLVICTANSMYKTAKSLNNNSILVQNGNNFETFSRQVDRNVKNEISDLNKPIIGYLGAIKVLLDFNLLDFLITNLKNVYFVFIGMLFKPAEEDFRRLLKYENVIWINFKEAEKLPEYVNRFSVGILPFKMNNYTEGVFPNKFFEYMAAQIPIVTTSLPDLEKYSDYIGYSKNNSEFLENCKKAINGDFKKQTDKYLSLARENSWREKAAIINNKMLSLIR